MKDTKEKILDAALTLFSAKGYDGVSVKDIAEMVGIKDSSLYKHYQSKQEIFDSIVERSYAEYNKTASFLNIDADMSNLIEKYKQITEEELLQISYGLFLYFTKDNYASKFRMLLTMEQYRNPKISALYKHLYTEQPLAYQTMIFKGLVDSGIMINADPNIIALHFYSPIFLLITNYDEKQLDETQALAKLTQHVKQFRQIYNKES